MSSPFKTSPIRLKSPRDNLGSSMMESAYKTQQDLMARKARENGIPTSEIKKRFQATLSQIYQENPQCTEAWALGKAECHVWTQFFPNDPWPGILPSTSQSPFSNEIMRSESGEITSSPEKGSLSFPSRPKPNFSIKIEDVLLNTAGNPNVLAFVKRVPFPATSHPDHTFSDLQMPIASTLSWQAEEATSRRRSRSPPIEQMGRDRYRPNRSEGTTRQGRTIKPEESLRNLKAVRVGEAKKDSGNVMRAREDDPLTYGPKENEMQKKAYIMGGVEFRHVFFRALQTSRDFVRARHPYCDRSQKHWLADRMAWETVFKNEPFPWLNNKPAGIPSSASLPPIHKTSREITGNYSMAPPPAQIVSNVANTSHHPVYSISGSRSTQSRPSSAYNANASVGTDISGGATPFESSPEMPRKLSAALLNKGVMNTIGEESSENNGTDLVEGRREVAIRKNTLFRALLGDWDDSFKSVQRGLGVTIDYHDDASGHFKLTIEPYQPGDNVALERAHKFLEIWKRLIYSDQLIKLEYFWAQYKNHDKATAVNRKPMIHVNGKKILCQGKFGDLCGFFSQEIQEYQSNMAEYAETENGTCLQYPI
ncbi:uncharacterized protein EAF01_002155 [Botrytis porri]|uniref:uncharacterized protein n=1 Tax=Botrytis porri TaxID=87229 RepID=UPI0018FFD648|nr:uncharacterized protein EAF01_002155 [Botrytis porri]KAF7910645.1 hypothetical protein EAF01_002155 [Botrytis porri]